MQYIYMEQKQHELSYYRLYLQRLLRELGDSAVDDDNFLDARSSAAEEAFEDARRDGYSVNQAQELAMSVLFEGYS